MIVRTQDDRDLEKLQAAGATEVVPEALEGSLMLASHALALVGVPMRRVIRIVQDQRDARYSLLRGYFHGADDDTVDELRERAADHASRCRSAPARWAARSSQMALHATGVRVVSLRRSDGKPIDRDDDPPLADGDTLVLSGTAGAAGGGRGETAAGLTRARAGSSAAGFAVLRATESCGSRASGSSVSSKPVSSV